MNKHLIKLDNGMNNILTNKQMNEQTVNTILSIHEMTWKNTNSLVCLYIYIYIYINKCNIYIYIYIYSIGASAAPSCS